MPSHRQAIYLALVALTFLPGLAFSYSNGSGDFNEGIEEEVAGGIKLAKWDIEEFGIYFAVILTIIAIILFKMYYPKIPYVPDYIPQSLLLIVIGVIYGAILNAITKDNLDSTFWKLKADTFFHFLLPPIVLDSAYGLYNRTFLDFLGSILLYAVVGTVLNFLIVGPVMYGLDKAGAMGAGAVHIPLNSYLLFAALIVAVDPVAVLAVFQDIGVEPGLYYMVFGESLLNDAVTVVLYRIMSAFVAMPQISGSDIGLGIGSFFTISLGGLVVGVLIGIITSFFTRWTGHFGCVLIFITAYLAYILGECLGWSGIISMIGCGLVQADYAFHNISHNALNTVHLMIKEIAEVSESLIFFLIGVQLFTGEVEWSTGFSLWGMTICLVARTIVTLVLTALINCININTMRVTFKEQAIIIFGGLRGAVALSLALLIEAPDLGANGAQERRYIITATLFIILFTVGFMGLLMKPLVKLFRIKLAAKEELSLFGDLNGNIIDHTLAGVEAIIGSNGRNRVRAFFTRIDDRFIRRWLQRNPETHDERIVRTYESIALKLHYASIRPSKSSTFLSGLPETIKQKHLAESGDSALHLPALAASASDPRLLELFTVTQGADSTSNLAGQSSDSLNRDSRKVTFGDGKLDNDTQYVDPEWRRRTSVLDTANQDNFEEQMFSVMKSKWKAARFLKLRKHRSKTNLIDDEQDSALERERDRQTAVNTAMNRVNTKPDSLNRSQTSIAGRSNASDLPPRDYPAGGNEQAGSPKFHIGDED